MQCRTWFYIALVASLLIRIICAALLPLSNDEAYHWLWTYNPSLGYYDHPGLFAYVLWPFTAVFGHDCELVIRIPSLIAMTLCPIAIALLAKEASAQVFADDICERCAYQAGILTCCLPLYLVLGMYHTGDASVICMWAWSLLWAFRCLVNEDQSWKPWIWLGICVGLGFQAKYLFFMFVPLFGAYILIEPEYRHWARSLKPYVALLIGFVIFLPNLYWNSQNDWATFVFNFASRHDKEFEFKHVLEFICGTLMLGATPGLMIWAISFLSRHVYQKKWYRLYNFFFVFSFIPIAYFLYRSFGQRVGMHWPSVTYLALCALAPFYWCGQMTQEKPWWKLGKTWVYTPALLLVSIISISLLFVSFSPRSLLTMNANFSYSSRINSDNVNELFGWAELGTWVEEQGNSMEADGAYFLFGPQYGFVSQLAYYHPQHPHVYLWEFKRVHGQHFKLLDDYSPLKNQNALFVAKTEKRLKKYKNELAKHFDEVGEVELKDIIIDGQIVRQFALVKCYNFNGLTPERWDKD